jgi:hypothetical protein
MSTNEANKKSLGDLLFLGDDGSQNESLKEKEKESKNKMKLNDSFHRGKITFTNEDGKVHRVGGPAIIDTTKKMNEYFLNGERLEKKDYLKKLEQLKSKN